ncbi:MAG: hypothetical protein AB1705_18455 [Verrucomicrobiota bacterium]
MNAKQRFLMLLVAPLMVCALTIFISTTDVYLTPFAIMSVALLAMFQGCKRPVAVEVRRG